LSTHENGGPFGLNLSRTLRSYLQGTRDYSIPRFIVEFTLIAFPLKVLFVLPWVLLGGKLGSTTEAVYKGDPVRFLLLACVAAPLLETFVGQWIPIRLTWFFSRRWSVLLLVSATVFAAQHLHVGFSGFLFTFPVAFLLSWSFLVYREYSRWRAYWVTAAIHSLHNFITAIVFLLTYTNQSGVK
jgi:membrane protease YdiL (CAAX protease family)